MNRSANSSGTAGSKVQQTELHISEAMHGVSDAKLAQAMREYWDENCNQGWDGFNSRDLVGVRKFMSDFIVWVNETDDFQTEVK